MSVVPKKAAPRWLPAALDYGPLVLFFGGYKILGVLGGTAIFMVAISTAVVIAKWKLGRISPMMWMSAILVIVFGSLTLYLHDPKFIQIKPTIIYSILSAMLFGGLLRGRALLKYVLEHGYDGLSDKGWLLLSRNWAWYFAAMAVSNEVLRASVEFDAWLTIKVWGVTILTILFAAANVPMLIRHGLGDDDTPSTQ